MVVEGKERMLFREPVGVDPESYTLIMKDCGRCPSCLEKRARDLAIRAQHEARMQKANSFITLTYDEEHLPRHGSLSKRDAQLFEKRLRKALAPKKVRILLVAEYGSHTYRAHYHALVFGEDFRADAVPAGKSKSGFKQWESPTLAKAWGKGRCTVGELTLETCFYVCRYALKSAAPSKGDGSRKRGAPGWWQHPVLGVWLWREAEFQLLPMRPGLGRMWFEKFHSDVVPHDEVVVRGGQRFRPPRYYDKIVRSWDADLWQSIRAKREEKALQGRNLSEGAPGRLAAREEVQRAKHNLSKRAL